MSFCEPRSISISALFSESAGTYLQAGSTARSFVGYDYLFLESGTSSAAIPSGMGLKSLGTRDRH
jgi:hypothetical protein